MLRREMMIIRVADRENSGSQPFSAAQRGALAAVSIRDERRIARPNLAGPASLRTPFETRKPEFGGAIGRTAAWRG